MKKVNLILATLFLITMSINNNANAQFFKKMQEKLNSAIEKQEKKAASKYTLDPTISQGIHAKDWKDGEYSFWKRASGGALVDEYKAKLVFNRADDGSVISFDFIEGESVAKFEADEKGKSNFIRFFKNKNDSYRAVFFKDVVILLNVYNDEYGGKQGSYAYIENAEKYIEDSKAQQEGDLAAYKKAEEDAEAAAAAKRKANFGLEGKKVKSIAVTDISADHYGFYRPFSYQITATLTDGKTISTKNGGFWEDYEITYANAEVEEFTKKVMPKKFIEGDAIVIDVVNKHDRSIKTQAKIPMKYDEDLAMKYSAYKWGTSANNFKIEVKQVKHAINGSDILKIRFTDLSGEYGVQVFKMRADKTFHVFADGQPGHKTVMERVTFAEYGPGQDAGNGGNITVIKDPSVKEFNLEYTNKGGIGGAGTYGYNRGRDGRDGTFKEEVRSLNF